MCHATRQPWRPTCASYRAGATRWPPYSPWISFPTPTTWSAWFSCSGSPGDDGPAGIARAPSRPPHAHGAGILDRHQILPAASTDGLATQGGGTGSPPPPRPIHLGTESCRGSDTQFCFGWLAVYAP